MRPFLSTAIAACLFMTGYAQDEPRSVSSRITEVTVFLNGAQVQRNGAKSIGKGITTLKFDNLSASIDPNSIQVSAKGAMTILSVTHQMNYLKGTESNPRVKELKDSLEYLDMKLNLNTRLSQVYVEERSMLQANKTIQVNEKTIFAEDLEDVANFYRDRMSEIMLKTLELETLKTDLKKHKKRVQTKLREITTGKNQYTGEILVEVSAEAPVNAKMQINYMVRKAGWTPIYDLRAKDTSSPIKMDYKAKVWQSSGVDWKNVKLTLSTGNPTQSGTKPEMKPWILRCYTPSVSYGK